MQHNRLTSLSSVTRGKDVQLFVDIAVSGAVVNKILFIFLALETDGIRKRQVSVALNTRYFAEENRPAHALQIGH